MKLLFPLVAAALLLAGCQQSATVRDSQAGGFVALDGAQLRLIEPLRVAAGRARVFIQDGGVPGDSRPLLRGGFDQYRPHCAIEIDSVDHDGVTIEPDTFQIVRVQHSLQQVVERVPRLFASLDVAGLFGRDGSSSYHEGYHLTLYSERQPGVMRMSCYGVYAQPYELYPPTLGEMRAALAGVAEIRR